MLSKKSLEILKQLFDEKSSLNVPVGVLDSVLEIRQWVEEQIKGEEK